MAGTVSLSAAMQALTVGTTGDFDSADSMIINKDDGSVIQAKLREAFAENILSAHVSGSTTGLVSSSTYTAFTFFTDAWHTTTPTGLTPTINDAADPPLPDTGNTGITANVPVRYIIRAHGTFEAATNADFTFAVFADGVRVSDEIQASGLGAGKRAPFLVEADSGLLGVGGKAIDLRYKNNGDTFTAIQAQLWVDFYDIS